MPEFKTPIDIVNRALQHCGATRIDPTQGFAEVSRNSSETAFCYGKLREAELQSRVWTFATRRTVLRAVDANTMLLTPSMWVAGTTYFAGSIVADETNNLWISRIGNNLGNDPQNSLLWEPYFGPMTVPLWAATTAYYSGEVVYTAPGDGTSRIYLSLQNGNSDVPGTAAAYDATATYFKDQIVSYLGTAYMSLIDLNIANTPSASPAAFNIATTYASGDQVAGSDGVTYTSAINGNVGNDPTLDSVSWTSTGTLTPWTSVFVGGAGSAKWLQIGGAEFPYGVGLTTLNITYPIGAGPSTESTSSNVYRLPAGYLRLAPQNPKTVGTALGGPSGVGYNDWMVEGGYLTTSDLGPIRLRFVANVTDVSRMHTMFCEGLAARIGLEVCELLTQSTSKLSIIAKVYDKWMSDAKTQDAIEAGYDDPPDDDYVSVRS